MSNLNALQETGQVGTHNRWRVKDFLHTGIAGFPKEGMISIDVTYQCNLACTHCYFRNQGYTSELTVDQWLQWLENRRRQGYPFLICGWLGGEPFLRPDVLEQGIGYFKSNVIFTNGTSELPPWRNCTFVVSVPGLRDQYHRITGSKRATFDRVKAHADRKDARVFISFCVTKPTVDLIASVIEEWAATAVQGVYFEFYTPLRGSDLRLWVDWENRDRIIGELLQLKKTYGDFIANTRQELLLMTARRYRTIIEDCPFRYVGASFDPLGRRKLPCAIGPDADCSRCGCILPAFAQILASRRRLVQALWNGAVRQFRAG